MAVLFVKIVIFASVLIGYNYVASMQIPERLASGIRANEEILESIESLAASKILMDHTSSAPIFKLINISQPSLSTSSTPSPYKVVKRIEKEMPSGGTVSESEKTAENIRSPLHVAQCRATCLDKLASKVPASTLPNDEMDVENTRLLPNLLRLKRKQRFSTEANKLSASSACFHDSSSECYSCWKSCQLLEIRTRTPTPPPRYFSSSGAGNDVETRFPSSPLRTPPSVVVSKNGKGADSHEAIAVGKEDGEAKRKSKLPILACSNNDSQQTCTGGCQVACSFYKQLLTEQEDASSDDPVVATKHEKVLKILPGKISWPLPSSSVSLPVVYVVIQKYPDRKWRQIAQTTELELGIPSELTATMNKKLDSIRVLVVGPSGLRSVYSPLESIAASRQWQSSAQKESDKLGRLAVVVAVNEEQEEPTTTTAAEAIEITTETNDDTENNNNNSSSIVNVRESSESDGGNISQEPQKETTTMLPALLSLASETFVYEPFELQLVSLIHQKSLVIAELRWEEIGGNENQDYLITWELTGGGLKGHLVTDTTSVTLSLWPDTTYEIQVEKFEQNLDSDGEQPAAPEDSSSSSLKSIPLIVDTSVASFPVELPSALLGSKSNNEHNDEDEDFKSDADEFDGEEDAEEEYDEQPDHKSIGKVLGIAFVSLVLVILILTLVAFMWTRFCMRSSWKSWLSDSENGESGCFSRCFNNAGQETDSGLLVSQSKENFYSVEPVSPFYSLVPPFPFNDGKCESKTKKELHGTLKCSNVNASQAQGNMSGQQDEKSGWDAIGAPVAVISSTASSFPISVAIATAEEISNWPAAIPCSPFNCYYNNVLDSRTGCINIRSHSRLTPVADSTRNCSS